MRSKRISAPKMPNKVSPEIEELQVDLDNFMDYYNYWRTHQGYKLKKNGYRTPAEGHFQKKFDITKRK